MRQYLNFFVHLANNVTPDTELLKIFEYRNLFNNIQTNPKGNDIIVSVIKKV